MDREGPSERCASSTRGVASRVSKLHDLRTGLAGTRFRPIPGRLAGHKDGRRSAAVIERSKRTCAMTFPEGLLASHRSRGDTSTSRAIFWSNRRVPQAGRTSVEQAARPKARRRFAERLHRQSARHSARRVAARHDDAGNRCGELFAETAFLLRAIRRCGLGALWFTPALEVA